VTRQAIREALNGSPLDEVALLADERDADWISDRAVAILDQIGAVAEFPPSWWRARERAGERRMARLLREVLTDIHVVGQSRQHRDFD
jgi:hypothetical protein